MRRWALVPIKEDAACKMRLAHILAPAARRILVGVLLDHVIDTLRGTSGLDEIVLVTPDPKGIVAKVSARTTSMEGSECDPSVRIRVLPCERRGLNEDLSAALHEAARYDTTHAVIIPADLPLLESADVDALLMATTRGGVAIAPDRRRSGTNALAIALPSPIDLSFGQDSFAKHVAALRSRGVEPSILERPGLAFDVDDADDLSLLVNLEPWNELLRELTPVGRA